MPADVVVVFKGPTTWGQLMTVAARSNPGRSAEMHTAITISLMSESIDVLDVYIVRAGGSFEAFVKDLLTDVPSMEPAEAKALFTYLDNKKKVVEAAAASCDNWKGKCRNRGSSNAASQKR